MSIFLKSVRSKLCHLFFCYSPYTGIGIRINRIADVDVAGHTTADDGLNTFMIVRSCGGSLKYDPFVVDTGRENRTLIELIDADYASLRWPCKSRALLL